MFEFEIKILELILAKGFVAAVVFVSSWLVDFFGFLAAFETCQFWVLIIIIALYLRHIDTIGIRPVFIFLVGWE